MKLYATTTSERASKGQGGNKDILTVFTAEISGKGKVYVLSQLSTAIKDITC